MRVSALMVNPRAHFLAGERGELRSPEEIFPCNSRGVGFADDIENDTSTFQLFGRNDFMRAIQVGEYLKVPLSSKICRGGEAKLPHRQQSLIVWQSGPLLLESGTLTHEGVTCHQRARMCIVPLKRVSTPTRAESIRTLLQPRAFKWSAIDGQVLTRDL